MNPAASITSTPSFHASLLRADRWRIVLMTLCYAVVLGIWALRRAVGGVVASADAVFYPTVVLMCAAIAALLLALWDTNRRILSGTQFPRWRLISGAAVDLAVPVGSLLILQVHSPRGSYAALSGPTILLLPIVILLSTLRLRPAYSAGVGAAAAAAHWVLAARAVYIAELDAPTLPVIFSYGVLLLITGAAAAVVAFFVRRYVKEAVFEAEAAERAGRALSAMEHELDIAREIQLGLLPSEPPTMPGFDIVGMARPAAKAGGDYYDWQQLPDGRLVVVIADVTGHGIGPALVMAVCRAYSRATAPVASSPGDLLERLNGLIIQDVKGRRFITMAVAVVRPDGEVGLLSAGHGPSFLVRASGGVERFGGDALPLGISDDERYDPTTQLRLDRGDVLVLLTDGFMEQTNAAGEQFGSVRLATVVEVCKGRPAKDFVAAVERAVADFSDGQPQGDDMTAVVIRRV